MADVKCRLWWPEQLLYSTPKSGLLLFGWTFDSGPGAMDVVVAAGISPEKISAPLSQLDLEEALQCLNIKMPLSLQYSALSIIGHCEVKLDKENYCQPKDICDGDLNGKLDTTGFSMITTKGTISQKNNHMLFGDNRDTGNFTNWSCGCHHLSEYFEKHRQASIKNSKWVHVISAPQRLSGRKSGWVPKVHHMHNNDQLLPLCHLHAIVYESPTFGRHHFCLSTLNSSKQGGSSIRKPNWLNDLYKNRPLLDLDTVILSLNCSNFVKESLGRSLGMEDSIIENRIVSMLTALLWNLMAVFVSSAFTFIYILLQICYNIINFGPWQFLLMAFEKLFQNTLVNVHIRSTQFLYWPIVLQDSSLSSHSNIEYAHKTALRRHAVWSNVIIDVILGSMLGLFMLVHAEDIHHWAFSVTGHITNNVLRSGCVWLMGVPAGFKLNTEIAKLFGMISLNAIQIWSTLGFFINVVFWYATIVIALSGFLLGFTVPAALCIDLLKLATFHISILHWLISFLYSQQIKALASLWRLFRGQKWNPLRQRLDSYEYNVEEHVVGSLLFTPILLLLPTTSVFYIFFTIITSFISFICVMIEVLISINYTVPHADIILWLMRRGRFPSGVWFEIISTKGSRDFSDTRYSSDSSQSSLDGAYIKIHSDFDEALTSIFLLRSNFLNFGHIFIPVFKKVFHGVKRSSTAAPIYGILHGKRVSTTFGAGLPPPFPWMSLTPKEYWRLCHTSVLSCRP